MVDSIMVNNPKKMLRITEEDNGHKRERMDLRASTESSTDLLATDLYAK